MCLFAQYHEIKPIIQFTPTLVWQLVIGGAIGTLIGAEILRAACWLYNKIARKRNSSRTVPEPDMGKAMLITFLRVLVNVGTWVILTIAEMSVQIGEYGVIALTSLVGFLIAATMISGILPTTYNRALLVALIHFAVEVVVALGAAAIAAAVYGGITLLHK
jgi:hypothetical protein